MEDQRSAGHEWEDAWPEMEEERFTFSQFRAMFPDSYQSIAVSFQ